MTTDIQKKILHLEGLNEGLQALIESQPKPNKTALELLSQSRAIILQLQLLIK